MEAVSYEFLRFVEYKELGVWAVKNYLGDKIISKYKTEYLGKHIIHQNRKVKLNQKPNEIFGILGISNEMGMFDAYCEHGSKINQPYKIVENGYLAYNPYRINVGSVGIKTGKLKNTYISPAYVVFSCKKTLLPDFLHLILCSAIFNTLIRNSTTGSVRQTLGYDNLSNIKIPILPLKEQEDIVTQYTQTIAQAIECERKAAELESGIDKLLFDELGLEEIEKGYVKRDDFAFLKLIEYKNVSQWGVDFIISNRALFSDKYTPCPISSICKVGSGGTPSRSNLQYYKNEIPWIKTGEVVDEIIYDTEERISIEAVESSSAKIYPAGSLIIAMYGQGKTRGRTAKLGIDATTNQACAVLYDINTSLVNIDFLWAYLQGEYDRLRKLAYGNNQPNLNAQMIKEYPVFLPPLPRQEELVEKFFAVKEEIKVHLSIGQAFRTKAKQDFEKEVFEVSSNEA